MIKIKYLDIDETFYIENDVVKVKQFSLTDKASGDYSLDDMWKYVKKIVLKAKEYHQKLENGERQERKNQRTMEEDS